MFSMTAPAFMKPEGKAHARFATAEEGAKLPTPKSLQSALEDASYSQLEDRLEASLLSVATTSYAGAVDCHGSHTDAAATSTHASGVEYRGRCVSGYRHGRGALTFPDGRHYEGYFEKNEITGQGTMTYEASQYCGELRDGLHHGLGTLRFTEEPMLYEGNWVEGQRHGSGKVTLNAEGTHAYTGAWHADQKHGWGSMQYPSGAIYEGEWCYDRKQGFGTMYWAALQERYRGQWADNAQSGLGEHVWYQGIVPRDVNHAVFLRQNRYVGMFRAGRRSGEGTMLYAAGSRYEGEWRDDVKHGEGVHVFEDGSVWQGRWEADVPVVGAGAAPFRAQGPDAKVHVGDLLADEPSAASASRGITNVQMAKNSELRVLYDIYCTKHILWLDDGTYSRAKEQRPSTGLLSIHMWQLCRDAGLFVPGFTLKTLNEVLHKACQAPAAIEARRARISKTENKAGVWTFAVPLHSPFLELGYPDFCEALVRIADKRFPGTAGLQNRLQLLIPHLMCLLEQPRPAPMQQLTSSLEFSQYFQTIQPIMRILFCMIASRVKAEPLGPTTGLQPPSSVPAVDNWDTPEAASEAAPDAPPPRINASEGMATEMGLVLPPSGKEAHVSALLSLPHDKRSHPLDIVPKDDTEYTVLCVWQLLAQLRTIGVVKRGAASVGSAISPQLALHAIKCGCFQKPVATGTRTAVDNGGTEAVQEIVNGTEVDNQGEVFNSALELTFVEFVLALVAISQVSVSGSKDALAKFKLLVDGPRGFMAETLRTAQIMLPAKLKEDFAYLLQSASGRSKGGSLRSRQSRASGQTGSGPTSAHGSDVDLDAVSEPLP